MEIIPTTIIGQKEYPAISLLLPTHPAYPKFKIDRGHLQELVVEAERQVKARFSPYLSDKMMGKLSAIINDINYTQLSKGLAIYVSPHHAKVIHLPFEVTEKVVVDESFEVRDLIYAAQLNNEYLLAMITKNGVRTMFGFGENIIPVHYKDMPEGINDVINSHSLPGWDYLDTEAYDEKNIHNFLRFTDDVLEKELKGNGMKMIVIGDRKLLGYFKAQTKSADKIIGYVEGNYEHASNADLKRLIKPLFDLEQRKAEVKALTILNGAVNTGHFESGITAVWRAVEEGRGRMLLVEKDYRQVARFGDDGMSILLNHDILPSHYHLSDAVDDLIEKVMLMGGEIKFVQNGSLTDHQRIALITHY